MVDRKELGEATTREELIPGSPEALYKNAEVLRDRAIDVTADGEALKRIDVGAWRGPAYDAYAEENELEVPKWLKTGDALAYGAQAVENYANCLGWAQMQAEQALELYNRGQTLTQQANAAHNHAVAEASAQTQANAGRGDPTVVQPPPFNDTGEEYRQAAREILDRARHQLDQVADESANALNELAAAAPSEDDEETTASKVGHTILDGLGMIPVVGELADGANAAWHALQGHAGEAALSGAAAIPIAGWAAGAGKIGKAIGKALEKGEKARFGWSSRIGKGAYRDNFFDQYPELRGQVEVHHAVEQQVITKKYPHLDISLHEMHSLDNLRGIPNDVKGVLHRGQIRGEWDEFYRENPGATKQDLLDFATKVDEKFGHLFRPPVR
ncbi:putative T7SS-secreted protein [Amycolatopsis anabasis]|uniref:putative T7SS-secreted protein n=1 Tax=Amycolatopsis anabasis TaxID=1840409 RepID=UPI00131B3135|nr:hypothetical protein [Amycolatopsis anabasis]